MTGIRHTLQPNPFPPSIPRRGLPARQVIDGADPWCDKPLNSLNVQPTDHFAGRQRR